MQIIISLLRLQSDKLDDKQTKDIFIDCQNRVLSMSLIHEKMYQSENLSKINARDYFPQLINDIIASSNINKDIFANIIVDSVEIPTKMMVPLGLLVNEIVLNSMKHAFNNTRKGEIIFHLLYLPNKRFKLLIGDDGSGIKPEFESKKTSLGMELIESFVDQLDGTISKTGSIGTLYEIKFGFVDLK